MPEISVSGGTAATPDTGNGLAPRRFTARLKKLAREIVGREKRRRGESYNATVNALVTEWAILQRLAAAAKFRHDQRDRLNSLNLLLYEALSAESGEERDRIRREFAAVLTVAANELVLVPIL